MAKIVNDDVTAISRIEWKAVKLFTRKELVFAVVLYDTSDCFSYIAYWDIK